MIDIFKIKEQMQKQNSQSPELEILKFLREDEDKHKEKLALQLKKAIEIALQQLKNEYLESLMREMIKEFDERANKILDIIPIVKKDAETQFDDFFSKFKEKAEQEISNFITSGNFKGEKGDSVSLEELNKIVSDYLKDKIPTESQIIETVVSMMPEYKQQLQDTPEQIVNKINSTDKKISLNSINGLMEEIQAIKKMIRENRRVGGKSGGGDVVEAGTNITITRDSSGRRVISSTGGSGGFTKLTATGTIDGNNTTFTFTQEPSFLIVDGIWSEKTNPDSSVNWTWTLATLTAVLTIPPNKSLVGIA